MFTGAVPLPAVEQITRAVPFTDWREVYVGCSGSFRFDRAVKGVHPSVNVHSNDVSLLSCALGALATGTEFPIAFTERLAFIEPLLEGWPFIARVGAVGVALEMAKYKHANEFAVAHFNHYRDRFSEFLDAAIVRLSAFLEGLQVSSFHPGDFRLQAQRAAEAGGGVAAFPPTYKNGYEHLYKFLDQNTAWQSPAYEVWDPERIEDWIDELDAMKVRYCVLTDHKLDHHEPATVYRGNSNKPVFTFADRAGSSVRRQGHGAAPFRYRPLDPDQLTANSTVEIIGATTAQMNFLKDIYLQKDISHTGGLANFLVLVDGCLAGGFIYARRHFESDGVAGIYLLSDFALSPRSRVSKLVAMLATSRTVISRVEIKLVQRIEAVYSTAFTNNPVSMKYRGIYNLAKREPGKLSYASKVRNQTPAELYAEWFQRFIANARHPGPAKGPEAAGEERALHEGAAVRPAGRKRQSGRVPDQLPAREPAE